MSEKYDELSPKCTRTAVLMPTLTSENIHATATILLNFIGMSPFLSLTKEKKSLTSLNVRKPFHIITFLYFKRIASALANTFVSLNAKNAKCRRLTNE